MYVLFKVLSQTVFVTPRILMSTRTGHTVTVTVTVTVYVVETAIKIRRHGQGHNQSRSVMDTAMVIKKFQKENAA